MDVLYNLADGFQFVTSWLALATIAAGVSIGILVGAMPGLSPSMGVALLVPFTYTMDPTLAFVLLAAVYLAADYGGSITAVTINAPGTPSAAVTAFDGYPLTQQGKPGVALGTSLVASTVGGVIGTLILIFFSVPLARLALKFHPAEYFALAVFGLTSVASIAGDKWSKAFVAAMLGLLINTIGIDPISGVSRFTFGVQWLYDGFSLIPALIGLFAISEVFMQLEAKNLDVTRIDSSVSRWPKVRDYWRLKVPILRSSAVGTLIGIFPGAGATIASFVSYDITKRLSKTPEKFGHGCPEGVAAAEAANSSSVGGSLVPLLTLGIPGSASTAVLIGALMIHDVVPGPQLFSQQYLFDAPVGSENELDSAQVSDSLSQAFEEGDRPLSEQARISVLEAGHQWRVVDGNKKYTIRKGPDALNTYTNPELVYRLFASLLIANLVLLGLGLFGSRIWIKVTVIPKRILYPMILAVSVVGSFAVRSSLFDVVSCLCFGLLGWLFRRHQYPVVPIVLGMVLGTIAETNFRRAVLMGGYPVFFIRPMCVGILLVSCLSFAIPLWQSHKQGRDDT